MKFNLGSGDHPLEGYINVDRKTGGEVYSVCVPVNDWPGDPEPHLDATGTSVVVYHECATEVRASHLLEHFPHYQTEDVLRGWAQILKPGGALKVAVPNLDWILANRDHPQAEAFLMGGHVDDNDRHGAIFTEQKLRGLMKAAGLVDIKPWVSEIADCASLPVSLNLMGTKPDVTTRLKPRLQIPRTIAVMSCGRLGFTDFWENAYRILPEFKIPLATHKGVFWGHGLERLIDRAIVSGYEWILTLDHDTLFTRQDVIDLLRLMHDHPEADAIAPLQVKRSSDEVLAGILNGDKPELELKPSESPLVKVDTAHFGLTLLRASAVIKMKHPWFCPVPNEYGRWDDGRQDEDISFWWKFKEAGNSLYIAHRVAVGHVQELATWPTEDGGLMHEFVGKFHSEGKPQGVRK